MPRTRTLNFVFVVLLTATTFADELPPLEAYGQLPSLDMVELSPSGRLVATRMVEDGKDMIVVLDVDSYKPLEAADVSRVNPRRLNFVEEDKLILIAGRTVRNRRVRGGSFYHGQAFSFDLGTRDIRQLMQRAKGLYEFQGGLGRIVGRDPESQTLFMPAFAGSSSPSLGIYAVSLDGYREKLVIRGGNHTVDWFLGLDGKPIVREDFDDQANVHRIWLVDAKGRGKQLLYEEETAIPSFGTVGITPGRDALVLLTSSQSAGARSYYLLNLEHGEITGPVLVGDGIDVERVITDINRVVYGVEYSGFKPTYAFFDGRLNARVAEMQKRMQDTSSRLVSWNDDFSRLLFQIEGGWSSGAYLMFEEGVVQPSFLGKMRGSITKEFVVPVEITQYEARDGRTIPALVTSRQDIREAGNAPLIVIPHGGPRSHDRLGFDWIAQYFASRGYVVLQPQYRGSDGFGYDHMVAGEGEFGGKMLSDIDDGVRHLIDQEVADPERVCAVGASYGGYAALAAGAFSSDMYRCIVSIAGISDIPTKMKRAKRTGGSDNWGIDFWEELYGAETTDNEYLRSISPSYHADLFQAPVLLIHGERDTTVNIEQSTRMRRALRKAKKDVTFVKLKGEDHWLTKEESRIETLRAVAAFIEQHL